MTTPTRYWNYRIVEKAGTFGIHEVYYENGKPVMVSVEAMTLGCFESVDDLKGDLELLNKALEKPVLKYSDIVTNA